MDICQGREIQATQAWNLDRDERGRGGKGGRGQEEEEEEEEGRAGLEPSIMNIDLRFGERWRPQVSSHYLPSWQMRFTSN